MPGVLSDEEFEYLRGVLERMAVILVPVAWVRDRLGVEDLIQEVLVSVWSDFDPTKGTAPAFAKGIFRHRLLDARRKISTEMAHVVPFGEAGASGAESIPGSSASVGSGLLRSRRLQAYQHAIDLLGPEERVLLRLLAEGTSTEELARERGLEVGALRTWKCRALKRLRSGLRAAGYTSSSLFRS